MLVINKATYGGADCTEQISKLTKKGKLSVKANNDIIGDPIHGQVKKLIVDYILNGESLSKEVLEGNYLKIQSKSNSRLGIFYSNNTNPKTFPAIEKSLETIEKAADGVADIITCVWNPIPNNPFVELTSWMQSGGHLNQLMQIMQCLYYARQTGEYEWVSFLEHDVMYPEDYFKFKDDGYLNCVFTNMNYIGLCEKGFQKRKQDDQRFHQMTMRFEEAITHCENILANALVSNSGLIEPQFGMVRRTWKTKNPSVHINHGIHFTSHYSIYDSEKTQETNKYWGNYSKYKNLF